MMLQFGRSSGRKGDTDDDGDVVEESKGPFDFVVDILDAEDASAVCQHTIDPEATNERGKERLTLHGGYRPLQGESATIPRWK